MELSAPYAYTGPSTGHTRMGSSIYVSVYSYATPIRVFDTVLWLYAYRPVFVARLGRAFEVRGSPTNSELSDIGAGIILEGIESVLYFVSTWLLLHH